MVLGSVLPYRTTGSCSTSLVWVESDISTSFWVPCWNYFPLFWFTLYSQDMDAVFQWRASSSLQASLVWQSVRLVSFLEKTCLGLVRAVNTSISMMLIYSFISIHIESVRREECDTYLTHISRHQHSVENVYSWWKSQCWLKASYISYFHQAFSTPAMSTDVIQIGITLFPSF